MSAEVGDRVEILIDEAAGRLTLVVPTLVLSAFAGRSFGADLRTGSITVTELAITFRWPTAAEPRAGGLAVSATAITARDVVIAWSEARWGAGEAQADNVSVELRADGTLGDGATGVAAAIGLIGETALARMIVEGLRTFAELVAADASDPGQPARIAGFASAVLGGANALVASFGVLTLGQLSRGAGQVLGGIEAAALCIEATSVGVAGGDAGDQLARVLVVLSRAAWSNRRTRVRVATLRANAEARLRRASDGPWSIASWRVSQAAVGEAGAWNLGGALATPGAPTRISVVSGSAVGVRVADVAPGMGHGTGTLAWESLSATMALDGGAEAKGTTGFVAGLGQVAVAPSGLVVVKVREMSLHPTRLAVGHGAALPRWLGAAAGWTVEIPYAEHLRIDASFSVPARELSFAVEVASLGLAGVRRDGSREHRVLLWVDDTLQLQRVSANGSAAFPKGGRARLVLQHATIQQAAIPVLGVTSAQVPLLVLGQCRLSDVRVAQLDVTARTGSARVARLGIGRIETPSGSGALNAGMVDVGRAASGRWTVALAEGSTEGTGTLGAARAPWNARFRAAHGELAPDEVRRWQARWHADEVQLDLRWELDAPSGRARIEGQATGVASGGAAGDGSARCELKAPRIRVAGTAQRERRPSAFELDLRDAVTRVSGVGAELEASVASSALMLGPTTVATGSMTLSAARGGEIRDLALTLAGTRGRGLDALSAPRIGASHLTLRDARIAHADWSLAAAEVVATGLRASRLAAAPTLAALFAAGFHARGDVVHAQALRLALGAEHALTATRASLTGVALNPPGAGEGACTADAADADGLVFERPSGHVRIRSLAARTLSYRPDADADAGTGAFTSARFELGAPLHAPLRRARELASDLDGQIVLRLPSPDGEVTCTATVTGGRVAGPLTAEPARADRKGSSPLGAWAPGWLARQMTHELADALAARLDLALAALAEHIATPATPAAPAGDGRDDAPTLELAWLAGALTSEADAAAALWELTAPASRGLLRLAQDDAETWQLEPQATEIERARAVTRRTRSEEAGAWAGAIHVAFEVGGQSRLGATNTGAEAGAREDGVRLAASVASQLRAAGTLCAPLATQATLVLRSVEAGMGPVSVATSALKLDGAHGEIAAGTFALDRIARSASSAAAPRVP